MAIYSKNKALICKVFLSSLGSVAMTWFDSLEEGSIHSFEKLTRAFGARFVTCSRVPRPLNSLLSMSMKEGETLKNYLDRYWEVYNEIDGDFEDIAVQTFKVGLLTHFDLWKSLTMKPPRSMHQLMDRIEKHIKVEDNQNSSKGKAKVFNPDRRDSSSGQFTSSQPRREFFSQASRSLLSPQVVTQCSKSQFIEYYRRLKASLTLNSRTKWDEVPLKETRVCIISITRTEIIQSRTVGLYKTSLTN